MKEKRPYPCSKFDAKFSNKGGLTQHNKLSYEDSDVKSFNCDVCGKRFKLKQYLTQHSSVLKERNFECESNFPSLRNLKRHISLNHAQHKPFKCEVCDKTFGVSHKYSSHMKRWHAGNKKYKTI